MQGRLNTIQETIEKSLFTLYDENIRIIGSGRTDSGVHALAQVFHFYADKHRDNYAIMQALNSTLPRDIAVLSVIDAPEGFHAQFSAVSKTYKYIILNRPARGALDATRAWFRRKPLDEGKINEILSYLVGSHDFTSFCVRKSVKENCVRTLNFASAVREGDHIIIKLNAGGFLHNMIRIIVGTAVHMVYDNDEPSKIIDILEAKDRDAAGITAPAHGLYLEKVYY